MERIDNLIGGALRGGRAVDVQNPATLDIVGQVPAATAGDLDDAVAAARAALASDWHKADVRQAAMLACAGRLEDERDGLARLLSLEQGKTLTAARVEIDISLRILRHYTAWEEDPASTFLRRTHAETVRFDRLPVGVCGLVVPWNYPLAILFMKLGPALRAGNTLVIKPAPTTPLTTLRLAALFAEILPAGVINTVTGDGDIGTLLTAHGGIDKVSFTGSTATGRKVMASAAPTLKRLTLELGGNDPAIVLADADLERTAARLYLSAFSNAGQVCAAVKRVYVERRLHDDFVAALERIAQGITVGEGLDPASQMGPLHTAAQRDFVVSLLDQAAADGARIFRDGPGLPDLPGHFLRPAIVSNLPHDSALVQREQFGPALPVVAFDRVEEAVAMANDSDFGLGASVWSADEEQASAIAGQLIAGSLYINTHSVPPDPEVPFGGAKQSGLGVELGDWAMDEYTVRRVIRTEHLPQGAL